MQRSLSKIVYKFGESFFRLIDESQGKTIGVSYFFITCENNHTCFLWGILEKPSSAFPRLSTSDLVDLRSWILDTYSTSALYFQANRFYYDYIELFRETPLQELDVPLIILGSVWIRRFYLFALDKRKRKGVKKTLVVFMLLWPCHHQPVRTFAGCFPKSGCFRHGTCFLTNFPWTNILGTSIPSFLFTVLRWTYWQSMTS